MRKGIPARDGKATLMKGCMQRIRGERERGRMGVSREGRNGGRRGGRENLGADY